MISEPDSYLNFGNAASTLKMLALSTQSSVDRRLRAQVGATVHGVSVSLSSQTKTEFVLSVTNLCG